MSLGWVRFWRKILDSDLWAEPNLWRTFETCLLLANHTEGRFYAKGFASPIKVLPGQFVTGRESFCRSMYPKRRASNPTPITVWRWLKALEKAGKLIIETNNKCSLITIVNWGIYQRSNSNIEQQNDQQKNIKRSTGDQQMNTNKNEKNLKNEKKKYTDDFEKLWKAYPITIDKERSWDIWQEEIKELPKIETLLHNLERQKKSLLWNKHKLYIPPLSVWLIKKAWSEESTTYIENIRMNEKGYPIYE